MPLPRPALCARTAIESRSRAAELTTDPTRVGKTHWGRSRPGAPGTDPHAYVEDGAALSGQSLGQGRPPRVWGRHLTTWSFEDQQLDFCSLYLGRTCVRLAWWQRSFLAGRPGMSEYWVGARARTSVADTSLDVGGRFPNAKGEASGPPEVWREAEVSCRPRACSACAAATARRRGGRHPKGAGERTRVRDMLSYLAAALPEGTSVTARLLALQCALRMNTTMHVRLPHGVLRSLRLHAASEPWHELEHARWLRTAPAHDGAVITAELLDVTLLGQSPAQTGARPPTGPCASAPHQLQPDRCPDWPASTLPRTRIRNPAAAWPNPTRWPAPAAPGPPNCPAHSTNWQPLDWFRRGGPVRKRETSTGTSLPVHRRASIAASKTRRETQQDRPAPWNAMAPAMVEIPPVLGAAARHMRRGGKAGQRPGAPGAPQMLLSRPARAPTPPV
ncbi:hypothetical protein SAMN06272735_8908 [Streptomyces sp. TLI_55]|nr:hypothetical protein SAMN06272735_8908 [Streptomyces sp. TLI_55]